MVFVNLAFGFLSLILIFGALGVIAFRNPVHSVLSLILCFFTSSGLFIILGAEFVGLLMAIVYVGAVAVLFLFVVMMLDIDFAKLRGSFDKYLPFGLIVAGLLFIELVVVAIITAKDLPAPIGFASDIENTRLIATHLYTTHIFAFQMAGLVLLVAMIGAILLTYRKRPGVKRQKIHKQVNTQPKDAHRLSSPEYGKGVKL